MPSPRKYPLAPLVEHRRRQVDDATAELAGAVRAREAAKQAKDAAEHERTRTEREAEAVREAEAAHLLAGDLRVADLARAGAWEHAAQAALTARTDAALEATDAHRAMLAQEATARDGLARTKADQDVIEKDRDRFERERDKRAAAAEEEAAAEAWSPARGTRA